jgi:hypothetical protein
MVLKLMPKYGPTKVLWCHAKLIVILEGSKITRRLVVYVPHPITIVGDYSERDPSIKANYARKLNSSLEWIATLVPDTHFQQRYFVSAITKRQPWRATKGKQSWNK